MWVSSHICKYRIGSEISIIISISSQFRLFLGKTNDKLFPKRKKDLFWGRSGPFLPKSGQK